MFWKKKKISTEKFTHESSDKRETFRFEFDGRTNFEIEFKEKIFPLINLSAAGMSFNNQDFSVNDCGMIKFSLTFSNLQSPVPIILEMKIIRIDENNICHAIFLNCSEENKEIIHKYILKKQKENIRAKYKNR